MSDWTTDDAAELELREFVVGLADRMHPDSVVRPELTILAARLDIRIASRTGLSRSRTAVEILDERDRMNRERRALWLELPEHDRRSLAFDALDGDRLCTREVYERMAEALAERLPDAWLYYSDVKSLLDRMTKGGDIVRERGIWRNKARNMYFRRPMTPEIEDLDRLLQEG